MVINYKDDTRYGDNQIISHDKMGIDSVNIEHLIELKNVWSEQYQKCSIMTWELWIWNYTIISFYLKQNLI